MLFMKNVELAARLQHSSNIDELMEGLNDRPQSVHKTAATSQSVGASSAANSDARFGPTDQRDKLILIPKSSYRRAA